MRSEFLMESGDIAAFNARAKMLADAQGKTYRIKQLSVNTNGGGVQPLFRVSKELIMSEAAPIPVEAGESLISATVSVQIGLE